MQRKYTVDEIDRMRLELIKWHPIREVQVCHVGMGEDESHPTEGTLQRRAARAALVEDQLRTYMLNGTDPDEICGAE